MSNSHKTELSIVLSFILTTIGFIAYLSGVITYYIIAVLIGVVLFGIIRGLMELFGE